MEKLSAVIISFNEEQDIAACLQSLQGLADEILVLDSFSTDGTEAICRTFGVRFEQHAFDGYVSQKNRALVMASHDLVLSLDADESLSMEAREAVLRIKGSRDCDGYLFNRRNSWCGHWMRHTSWYPDRKLRLFDRRLAHWAGDDPHDRIEMGAGARILRIDADILHEAVHSKAEYQAKIEHFATVSAQHAFRNGKKAGYAKAMTHSVWRWYREYCIKLGFLDGMAGWQVARFSAIYVWKKYLYLRNLYAKRG